MKQPEAACANEFSSKRDQLAAMGNPIMAQRPELEKLVGKGNAPMAEDNNRNLRPLYVIAVYRL